MATVSLFILLVSSPLLIYAQACPGQVLATSYPTPTLAPGFSLQVLTQNITTPRHIVFDSAGHLLVSGDPAGVTAFVFEDPARDGCVVIREQKIVVESGGLNLEHGISLSADGKTLYASSMEAAYAWTYDPSTASASNRRTIVTGMTSRGHTTRTLLASSLYPDFLIISRGSEGNLDYDTLHLATGRSIIKAFNVSNIERPYNYNSDGILLGWGLRNSVGVAEDRLGGVWSVENSADQIMRQKIDIHNNNPAEELNWHGYLNQTVGTPGYVGPNYGYPLCLAVWEPAIIPNSGNLQTGDQFTLSPNSTLNDTTCESEFRGPRLSFQAHTAPLDIKFHPRTGDAWIPFHGSWNRDDPVGYKLSYVPFDNQAQPIPKKNSTKALVDVVSNSDHTLCPVRCFRPVGVAFDSLGRAWMTSDSTGEVFIITPPERYLNGTMEPDGSEERPGTSSVPKSAPVNISLMLSGLGVGLFFWL